MSKEKSPAFQFYPRDLISDVNWLMMNYAEKGMYWQLISVCWLEDSLPADEAALAKILNLPTVDFNEAWRAIGKCFQVDLNDCSRLRHPRLDLERQKQAERRASSALGGRRSAHKRKHKKQLGVEQSTTVLLPSKRQVNLKSSSSSSSASSPSSSTEKKEKPSASPKKKATQIPDFFPVTEGMIEWAKAEAPLIDAIAETDRFKDYYLGTGKAQKDWIATWRNWMRNAQERRGNGTQRSYGKPNVHQTNMMAAMEWAAKGTE